MRPYIILTNSHNGEALGIIKVCKKLLPDSVNVGYFDSSFHMDIEPRAYTYMINQEKARKLGLRRYGFHGLSYAYITSAVSKYLNKPQDEVSIIALHLGSGASACAIKQGKSIRTSMGLTPLEGLPGATRSGTVDPSLIFHYTSNASKLSISMTNSMHITEAERILNNESGWKALTGTTDFGTISKRASQGDKDCQLANEVFIDSILDYVGSYMVRLSGKADALVFAGGIGEKGSELRKQIVSKCGFLGFELDEKANMDLGSRNDVVADIGKPGIKPRLLVVKTDEQLEMVRQCVKNKDLW